MNIQYQKNTIDNQVAKIQYASQIQKNELELERQVALEEARKPLGVPINVATRGMEEFRQVGILTSLSDSQKVLPLYGRRTYVRSQQWNYYTLSNGYQSFQISVMNKNKDCTDEYGCSEISNDDVVQIPAYNEPFRVLLYKNTAPRYIPYVI